MSDRFDPYLEWLAIPVDQRPPNHYAMLGLKTLESDVEKIESEFHRRYDLVRKYQVGEHEKEALAILKQLAKAHECLTNKSKKAAYDRKLVKQHPELAAQRKSAAKSLQQFWIVSHSDASRRGPFDKKQLKEVFDQGALNPTDRIELVNGRGAGPAAKLFPTWFATESLPEIGELKREVSSDYFSDALEDDPLGIEALEDESLPGLDHYPHGSFGLTRLINKWGVFATVGALAIVSAVLVAIAATTVWVVVDRMIDDRQQASGGDPRYFGRNPNQRPQGPNAQRPGAQRPGDQRPGAQGRRGAGNMFRRPAANPNPNLPTVSDLRNGQGQLNLSSLISVEKNTVQARWVKSGDGVRSPPVGHAQLAVPLIMPRVYTVTMKVRRVTGNESFNVCLPFHDQQVMVVMDGYGGNTSGLSLIRGASANRNPTRTDVTLFNDADFHDVKLVVSYNTIMLLFDNRVIFTWSGSPGEVRLDGRYWKTTFPQQLLLGSWDSSFEIKDIVMLSYRE